MKTYTLNAKIEVSDETIAYARKWEKKNNLHYGDNIAHLLMDCMTDNGMPPAYFEYEEVELDEIHKL